MAEYVHQEPILVPVGGTVDFPKSGEIQSIVKFPVYGPLPQTFRVYVDEKHWIAERVD